MHCNLYLQFVPYEEWLTMSVNSYFSYPGKDRTGLIAMLVLHVLGASDEEILDDYVLSDSVYG